MVKALLFTLFLAIPAAQAGNDSFAERVTLHDGQVFSASVAGSTFEAFDPTQLFAWRYGTAGSKWWSWTAANTGFAVLIKQGEELEVYPSPIFAVYAGNDLSNLDLVNWYEVSSYWSHQLFVGFNTTAGQTYSLGIVGNSTNSFLEPFLLGVADSPIIVEYPASQSLNAGDTAVFFVSSPSLPDGHVQWQHNSANIPNATNSTLSIYNVTQAEAGIYTVSIEATNNQGTLKRTVSPPATLTVSGEILQPGISIRNTPGRTNEIFVKVSGQPRQWYRIESTEDFVNWHVEPIDFVWDTVDSDHETPLPTSTSGQMKYLRARNLGDTQQSCSANLKKIQFAKQLTAMFRHYEIGSASDINEITAFLGEVPHCPQSGTYTYNVYGTPPACSLAASPGHTL